MSTSRPFLVLNTLIAGFVLASVVRNLTYGTFPSLVRGAVMLGFAGLILYLEWMGATGDERGLHMIRNSGCNFMWTFGGRGARE